jgi:hypothetical protein
MASKRRDRMKIHDWDSFTVLDLGEVEIWDGADLSLLRETQTRLIEGEGCRRLGVNLQFVKYIPSGFFGMLFDWNERGVSIRLYRPQPHVANMLWFRQFFEEQQAGVFELFREPKVDLIRRDCIDEVEWDIEAQWEEEQEAKAAAMSATSSVEVN